MKHGIKSAVFFLLYYTGVEWLLARLVPVNAAAVLMYHGVCDQRHIPEHIDFHLPRNVFERQMRALKRRYHVVPLAELVDALVRGGPVKKSVVLTFDDGYKNNAQFAAPVMDGLKLPYTVFVVTDYIGSGRWLPLNQLYWKWSQGGLKTDELNELRRQIRRRPTAETQRCLGSDQVHSGSAIAAGEESFAMLNWDEVREMGRAGADFGSHTHTHCNMAVESESQLRSELQISKEVLEKNLGRRSGLFAYPYGSMSESSRSAVKQAGYDCGISTEGGLVTSNSDRYRIPRLGNDRRIWMFTGEILYRFLLQAAKDAFRSPADVAPAGARSAKSPDEHFD